MATKPYVPTMAEHADELHPVPSAPPKTTAANASPSDYDARKIQRSIANPNPQKFTGKGTTGGIAIGNPFTAAADIVKNIRRR